MSGSHPVASGSIPGIGFSICVLLAHLAEHPLNMSFLSVLSFRAVGPVGRMLVLPEWLAKI
jgi:hypothetical protein